MVMHTHTDVIGLDDVEIRMTVRPVELGVIELTGVLRTYVHCRISVNHRTNHVTTTTSFVLAHDGEPDMQSIVQEAYSMAQKIISNARKEITTDE